MGGGKPAALMMQCRRAVDDVKPCTTHSASPLIPTRTVAAVRAAQAQRGIWGSPGASGVGARTGVKRSAKSRAGEVDTDSTSGAGVGNLRLVGASHALDDGAVSACEPPEQQKEPRGAHWAASPSDAGWLRVGTPSSYETTSARRLRWLRFGHSEKLTGWPTAQRGTLAPRGEGKWGWRRRGGGASGA